MRGISKSSKSMWSYGNQLDRSGYSTFIKVPAGSFSLNLEKSKTEQRVGILSSIELSLEPPLTRVPSSE